MGRRTRKIFAIRKWHGAGEEQSPYLLLLSYLHAILCIAVPTIHRFLFIEYLLINMQIAHGTRFYVKLGKGELFYLLPS